MRRKSGYMNYQERKKRREEWRSSPPILLVYRLLASLLALTVSRWLLYLFNSQFFHQMSFGEAFFLFFYGMRFDLSVTVVLNLPLILYYCFPSRKIFSPFPQKLSDSIYLITNAIAILLNFIDIITFRFFGRHLTIGFLKLLHDSEEVSWGTLGQVLFDHWYLLVLYVLFVLVINVVATHTRLREDEKHIIKRWHLRQVVSLLLMLILSLLSWRNELKARNVDMEMTLRYTNPQNVPILLNTPFCILSSDERPVDTRHDFDIETDEFIHTNLTANRFLVADSLVADTVPLHSLDANRWEPRSSRNGHSQTQWRPLRAQLGPPALDALLVCHAPMPTSRRGPWASLLPQMKHKDKQIHPTETSQAFYQLICL